MSTWTFTVPGLPWRNLSSNAGKRSRRDPWSVAESRGRLKNDTMEALKECPIPTLDRATATVTLHCTSSRPKAGQCPRCRLLGPDYPSWAIPEKRETPLPCVEYRPKDVGNIGGDVLKPVLDGLVWMEVLPDDDWTHLESVTLRIARVDRLDDERIEVTVQEVEEELEAA